MGRDGEGPADGNGVERVVGRHFERVKAKERERERRRSFSSRMTLKSKHCIYRRRTLSSPTNNTPVEFE